jgi:hypothetical protein
MLVVLLLMLATWPAVSGASDPFEPNETLVSAAGPLINGQPYQAAIESSGDKDFFFFYVTSAAGPDVSLAIRDLGGGAPPSSINGRIVDANGTPVGASLPYVEQGEGRTVTIDLKPQKYFVEVVPSAGVGDAYEITPGGGRGAFGAYSRIAAQCASATASVKVLRAKLDRATIRLQRATSRLRRTRYGSPGERKSARDQYRTARARVTTKTRARNSAEASQRPWCFIPQ